MENKTETVDVDYKKLYESEAKEYKELQENDRKLQMRFQRIAELYNMVVEAYMNTPVNNNRGQ